MNKSATHAKHSGRSESLGAIALILVGVIVLNAVATFALVGWRFDFTSEGLYSFSPGTRAILRSLKDPVKLDLYASRESIADIPELRAHSQRVEEYLSELASLSSGKLQLRVINPQPFSEDEDAARIAGLVVQPVNNAGGTAILGLVVTGPGLREKVIPVFTADRDSFIEYEVAKAIATVGRTVKPKVGLLSCMPLQPERMLQDGSMGEPSPAPFVVEQMRELFDLVEIADTAAQLPTGIDALLLVQPRKLPESMLRSIDAWAVAGKPLVVLADPFAETDQHPDSRAMGAKVSATTYDFPLLRAWGLDIPRDMTVGDMNFTTRIQTPGPGNTMRELNYVAWLSLTRAALNQSDPLTNRFEAINFKSVGEIQKLKDPPAGVAPNIEPLIFSSDKSQLIQSLKLGYFGDAEQLLRDLKPDGVRRVFAAWVTGPIGSLFTSAIGNANIVLIADADLLANETWVSVDPQTGMKKSFSDNGPLIIGLLERMAGDPAVATLRSRGGFRRPFEIVQELRKAAEAKYIAREKDLQLEVRQTEMNIAQLQQKMTGGETGPGKLSPEQQAELAQLQTKVNAYRKELRGVQYGLRQEVDALGQRLLILNVVLWPVIVAIAAGLWCWRAARRVDHSRPQDN
ncbi:MAG: hypothetical protein EXS12_00025 [Phycisphaerales bacterium]|nr:hypothetical protein [Phycisphaerales bacterium]